MQLGRALAQLAVQLDAKATCTRFASPDQHLGADKRGTVIFDRHSNGPGLRQLRTPLEFGG